MHTLEILGTPWGHWLFIRPVLTFFIPIAHRNDVLPGSGMDDLNPLFLSKQVV